MAVKFGEFGNLSMLRQTLTGQILAYKWYPYGGNLFICQTFLPNLAICQTLTLPNIPAMYFVKNCIIPSYECQRMR